MDIDTRRSLGIYSRVIIPEGFEELIKDSFSKLEVSIRQSTVRLGEKRTTYDGFQDNMLKLIRGTVIDEDDEIYTHHIYVVQTINEENEPDTLMMTWYDIPPEFEEDVWILYPMSNDRW